MKIVVIVLVVLLIAALVMWVIAGSGEESERASIEIRRILDIVVMVLILGLVFSVVVLRQNKANAEMESYIQQQLEEQEAVNAELQKQVDELQKELDQLATPALPSPDAE